jgi:hypothetical protein
MDAEIEDNVPLNPNYQCRGLRVYLHFMKYFVPTANARIQLTLYNGSSIVQTDDLKMCNWISNKFDRNNLMITQPTNPMNHGFQITAQEIARCEIIEISDETTWMKDFYRMQFDETGMKTSSDVNLLVQVMDAKVKPNTAIDAKPDYQCIAYGFLKVTNNDGTIKYAA